MPENLHQMRANLHNDVKVHSMNYLKSYRNLCGLFELHHLNLFNFVPKSTSLIPGHVMIDTMFLKKRYLGRDRLPIDHTLWNQVFDLNNKLFKPKKSNDPGNPLLTFGGTLQTDGISVSLLFKKPGLVSGCRSFEAKENDSYVKDHLDLVKQRRVLIDPNKRDMLYCFGPGKESENPMAIDFLVDQTSDISKFKKLRYTSMQRRRETGDKRFRKRREQMQRNFYRQQGWLDPDGNPVFDIELTKKTTDLARFEAYWIDFYQRRPILEAHYTKPCYRKMRLYRYSNEQRSEAKFINKFKSIYGTDCTVILGAWDASKCPIRGLPSTKCKGFRKMFRKAGYQVLILPEHNTSSWCCDCEGPLEKDFRYRESPKPYIRAKNRLLNPNNPKKYPVHGILRCGSVSCRAKMVRKLQEKARQLEDGFTHHPVKMAKVDAIRSRLNMAILFPNNPTWAIYRYWNRDDIATGNFKKKVDYMLANNGETPPYLRHRANSSGAVFAAAGP